MLKKNFSFILAVIISSFTIIPVIFLMNGGSYSYKNELVKKAKSYKTQKVKEYNSYKREIDRKSEDFIAESRENLLVEILDYSVEEEVTIIPHKTRNSNLMLKSNTISHKKKKKWINVKRIINSNEWLKLLFKKGEIIMSITDKIDKYLMTERKKAVSWKGKLGKELKEILKSYIDFAEEASSIKITEPERKPDYSGQRPGVGYAKYQGRYSMHDKTLELAKKLLSDLNRDQMRTFSLVWNDLELMVLKLDNLKKVYKEDIMKLNKLKVRIMLFQEKLERYF